MHNRRTVVAAIVRLALLCSLPAALGSCGQQTSLVTPTGTTLPAGTSQVSGSIAKSTGSLLAGATVTVTSAAGRLSTITGQNGRYTLAASGDTTVRAEFAGFGTEERRLTVTRSTTLDIMLARTMAADAYRLTFTASPSCALPSDATPRQYTATFVENAGRLVVYLGGTTLIAFCGDAGFTGVRDGTTVRFDISDDDMGTYSFIELLPGVRWLKYSGTAVGTVTGDTIVATFNGRVQVAPGGESPVAECLAADHRLVFTR